MRIGIVSTFNVECGISTYTEHLVEHYPEGQVQIFGNKLGVLTDTENCLKHPICRCWSRKDDLIELTHALIESDVDIVHIQHEFGLFQNQSAFVEMLKKLREKKIPVVVTFHTIFSEDHLNSAIQQISTYVNIIICHGQGGKDALRNVGVNNTSLLPHGSVKVQARGHDESRKYLNIPDDKTVILSLGFITPNKGAMDSVSAIYRLKYEFENLYFLIVGMPVVHDNNFANMEYCLKLFKRVKMLSLFDTVHIYPKYVSEKEIDYYAGASDIAIENYYPTHHSTSGMSHLVMSYGLPSISSKANILADLDSTRSLKYKIGNIEEMSQKLRILIRNDDIKKKLKENCLSYAEETSWDKTANIHIGLYSSLVAE